MGMAGRRRKPKPEVQRELKPRDFMGTGEVAEMLGVEPPRIGRWLKKEEEGKQKKLPDPVARLAMGPVFLREHIRALKRGVAPDEIEVTPLDLLGTREVGDVLDLKKDRVSVWTRKGIIPKPIVYLRAGPLWWRPDVRPLRKERERRRRSPAAA